MAIYRNEKKVSGIYRGAVPISKVYHGSIQVADYAARTTHTMTVKYPARYQTTE